MVRVLIAEDMHMLRKALVALLEFEPDIEVVAEFSSGAEILPRAKELRPDVAVLDIDLPGMDGLTAAAELHTAVPECRTMMLTSLGRPGNLRRALAAHVSGFLLKDSTPDKLCDAIRAVAKGERVIDPQLVLAALDDKPQPLTPRELEVLLLASQGEGSAQIAARLYLSVGTVRNYLTSVVTKLNARNRVDAIRIAREAGWL
ncbi:MULTISPECIES: response regulator transcription factor [Streptomyces]|uniref:Response regulator transcription factor n=1 Tax=Streptomyces lonegramiae TaxID=3075524 RepID=A0ABU2XWM8_9ACTN|nr:response regulator transcription factor [Streptomyces sp. DSM 41529]MDT0549869.1 response regulator transcription factor [Streptomyces sp. DSM 41529]